MSDETQPAEAEAEVVSEAAVDATATVVEAAPEGSASVVVGPPGSGGEGELIVSEEAKAADTAAADAEEHARQLAEKDAEIAALKAQVPGPSGYVTNEAGEVVVPPGMPRPKHSDTFAEAGILYCVTHEAETPEAQRDEQGNGLRVAVPCDQWVTVA